MSDLVKERSYEMVADLGAKPHECALGRQYSLKKIYSKVNNKVVEWIDFFADKKSSFADSFK